MTDIRSDLARGELAAKVPPDIMAIGEAWASKMPDTPIAAVIGIALMIDREQQRAAIFKALREPSEAMLDAADDPVHAELKAQGQFSMLKYGKPAFASYPFSMAIWKAMIDVATKEPSNA